MAALSRYYAASQVVEDARDELASLGLTSMHGLDLDNRDAKRCACGGWIPFFTWARPALVCEQCSERQKAEVEADAREEKGLPRAAPVVATTTEEIAF
jgi:hypothetical protein